MAEKMEGVKARDRTATMPDGAPSHWCKLPQTVQRKDMAKPTQVPHMPLHLHDAFSQVSPVEQSSPPSCIEFTERERASAVRGSTTSAQVSHFLRPPAFTGLTAVDGIESVTVDDFSSYGTASLGSSGVLPTNTFDLRKESGWGEHRATISLTSARALRGTPLAYVLQQGGRVLQNNAQARQMGLLPVVQHIDSFISYNGATPHERLIWATILHFNLALAATTACLTALAFAALSSFVVPYHFQDVSGETGIMNSIFQVPIFLFMLRFGRDILNCFRLRGPAVFVDKACVTPSEKEETIPAWGSFLHHSPRMLIIYSDIYLRKLWTVFEVTIWLLLHPAENLTVIPAFLPVTIVKGTFVTYIIRLVVKILMFPSVLLALGVDMKIEQYALGVGTKTDLMSVIYGIHLLIALPFFIVFASTLRSLARERGLMHARVQQDFSVLDTQCFYEADRMHVNGAIISLLKSLGFAAETTSDIEALLAFDVLVRKHVPPALEAGMGGVVPYKFVVMILQADLWSSFDRLAGLIRSQSTFQEISAYMLYSTSMFFFVGPLAFLLMFRLARAGLACKGCAEKILLLVIALGPIMFYGACNVLTEYLLRKAQTSNLFLFVSFVAECSLAFICCVAYHAITPPKFTQSRSRGTMRSETTWKPLVFTQLGQSAARFSQAMSRRSTAQTY